MKVIPTEIIGSRDFSNCNLFDVKNSNPKAPIGVNYETNNPSSSEEDRDKQIKKFKQILGWSCAIVLGLIILVSIFGTPPDSGSQIDPDVLKESTRGIKAELTRQREIYQAVKRDVVRLEFEN